MSGYEVLRSLRVAKVKTPILILSGMAGIEDKVKGLGFGADDYLTKPFHKDELGRASTPSCAASKGHAQSIITIGDLSVNLDQKSALVGGARCTSPQGVPDVGTPDVAQRSSCHQGDVLNHPLRRHGRA